MASDNSESHNNPDFQLGEIFNVKNAVAVITGESSFSEVGPSGLS